MTEDSHGHGGRHFHLFKSGEQARSVEAPPALAGRDGVRGFEPACPTRRARAPRSDPPLSQTRHYFQYCRFQFRNGQTVILYKNTALPAQHPNVHAEFYAHRSRPIDTGRDHNRHQRPPVRQDVPPGRRRQHGSNDRHRTRPQDAGAAERCRPQRVQGISQGSAAGMGVEDEVAA